MLPVYELNLRFKKSAKFDDVLQIETKLFKTPGVRIEFTYEIYNQHEELLTEASKTLIVMSIEQNRPIKCPQYILDLLKED